MARSTEQLKRDRDNLADRGRYDAAKKVDDEIKRREAASKPKKPTGGSGGNTSRSSSNSNNNRPRPTAKKQQQKKPTQKKPKQKKLAVKKQEDTSSKRASLTQLLQQKRQAELSGNKTAAADIERQISNYQKTRSVKESKKITDDKKKANQKKAEAKKKTDEKKTEGKKKEANTKPAPTIVKKDPDPRKRLDNAMLEHMNGDQEALDKAKEDVKAKTARKEKADAEQAEKEAQEKKAADDYYRRATLNEQRMGGTNSSLPKSLNRDEAIAEEQEKAKAEEERETQRYRNDQLRVEGRTNGTTPEKERNKIKDAAKQVEEERKSIEGKIRLMEFGLQTDNDPRRREIIQAQLNEAQEQLKALNPKDTLQALQNEAYKTYEYEQDYKQIAAKGKDIDDIDINDPTVQQKIATTGSLKDLGIKNEAAFARKIASDPKYSGVAEMLFADEGPNKTDKVSKYIAMTESEAEKYDYILAKYGKNEAEQYLGSVDSQLNQRLAEKEKAQQEEWIKKPGGQAYAIYQSAVGDLTQPFRNAERVVVDTFTDKERDDSDLLSRVDKRNEQAWDAVDDRAKPFLQIAGTAGKAVVGSLVGGGAGTLVNGAASTMSTSVGAAQTLGNIFNSYTSGYSGGYKNARKRGLSYDDAVGEGKAQGAISAAKNVGKKAVKAGAKEVGKRGITEGEKKTDGLFAGSVKKGIKAGRKKATKEAFNNVKKAADKQQQGVEDKKKNARTIKRRMTMDDIKSARKRALHSVFNSYRQSQR